MSGTVGFSIVIPVLNEEAIIASALASLEPLRQRGAEVIVVDGGSSDATATLATPHADSVLVSAPGRGAQLNTGAWAARGDLLIFLHADTKLPDTESFFQAMTSAKARGKWGFLNVKLSGDEWWTRVISFCINLRSRITGIGTGDQVFFIPKKMFVQTGGFPDIPLMEDVAMAKKLRKLFGRPHDPGLVVTTSSRKWRHNGIVRTVLLMWWLRLLYFFGISPQRLARSYYGKNQSL